MPKITFHPDVVKEVKSSYLWYEKQANGLGEDYLAELEISYQAIVELPNTWPKLKKGFRRFLLSKFPFSIIYHFNKNTVFVVAIMHNSRKPGYWVERI